MTEMTNRTKNGTGLTSGHGLRNGHGLTSIDGLPKQWVVSDGKLERKRKRWFRR